MKEDKDNSIKKRENLIDINKKEELKELKMLINKNEDDMKNIINEKDIIIKDLKNKINEQDNKIEIINNKLERMMNVFINEFKQKDNAINEINNKLLEQQKSNEHNKNLIMNAIDHDIKAIRMEMMDKEDFIFDKFNEEYNNLNSKIDEQIENFEENKEMRERLDIEHDGKIQDLRYSLLLELKDLEKNIYIYFKK